MLNGTIVGLIALLAGCSADFSNPGKLSALVSLDNTSKKPVAGEIVTEVKFKAGKNYGAASERIVRSAFASVPRGGGRAVVGKPYKINGRWYKPRHQPGYNAVGIASWYGPNFHGRKTANGEIYDQTGLSAAHPTLPLPSYVRVTNLTNKRSVIVRVNDRGPFHKTRIIDLSYRTAELLGTRAGGLAKVRVKYVGRARVDGKDERYLLSSYKGPGSVEPSKLAARKKLLSYAGLSGDEINQTLSGEKPARTIPVTPTRPILIASRPETRQAVKTSNVSALKPTLIRKVPQIIAAKSPVDVNAPLELRPRILFQPATSKPRLIRAAPDGTTDIRTLDRSAYAAEHLSVAPF